MDAMTDIESCDIGVWTLPGDALPLLWDGFFITIDTEERRKCVVDPEFSTDISTLQMRRGKGGCQKAFTYFFDEGCLLGFYFFKKIRDRLVKHGRISRLLHLPRNNPPPLFFQTLCK